MTNTRGEIDLNARRPQVIRWTLSLSFLKSQSSSSLAGWSFLPQVTRTLSSTLIGAASALVPNVSYGQAACRRSLAWDIRSCQDTSSVGHIAVAGAKSGSRVGDCVFVPGARCFGDVKGLFGGAAARLVVPGNRVVPIAETLGEKGVLIALAATAYHAIRGGTPPDLIVGHGVLGRLLARIALSLGCDAPLVWESDERRHGGADGYSVSTPRDEHRGFAAIYDVSGDAKLLDILIGRLAPRGEVVLAGFYSEALSFAFPPAFMKEARIRIAAEWRPNDLLQVTDLIESGRLSLDGLITHRRTAEEADAAYRTAFTDPFCLKMILDWRAT